ncbi:MAG: MFS transporter [Gammaproteobacteria bacterium PRO9]|nr:MFS transporter [Gammaproteobacteria bacterium PRO9]
MQGRDPGQPIASMPWPAPARAWYAVAVLVVAFVLSFIDRIVIALLVEPIKADLGVSDFGIGLLQGLAFAIFYALLGIPIGRLSDRVSRRGIIAAGIALWSLMTAACGLARSFTGLFFPKEKLGRALAVYQSGAMFGAGIAFLVGGAALRWLAPYEGQVLPVIGAVHVWQLAFFIVGLPGVLIALLMLTVKEPARRGKVAAEGLGMPLREVLTYMGSHSRVLLALFFGFALLVVPITSVLAWVPTYLHRVLGHSRTGTGFILGAMLLVLAPAAVYCGGWLIDRLRGRGQYGAPFIVSIGAAIALVPLSLFATTSNSDTLTLALLGPLIFCGCISQVAAPAVIQMMVPNEMRAQISAIWMLVMNLVATIFGPTLVGFVTVFVLGDDMAVGQSIAIVNVVSAPVAAVILWIGLKRSRIEGC